MLYLSFLFLLVGSFDGRAYKLTGVLVVLFDREKELAELESCTRSASRIALVLGVRRVGEASLPRVFASECGYLCILYQC